MDSYSHLEVDIVKVKNIVTSGTKGAESYLLDCKYPLTTVSCLWSFQGHSFSLSQNLGFCQKIIYYTGHLYLLSITKHNLHKASNENDAEIIESEDPQYFPIVTYDRICTPLSILPDM